MIHETVSFLYLPPPTTTQAHQLFLVNTEARSMIKHSHAPSFTRGTIPLLLYRTWWFSARNSSRARSTLLWVYTYGIPNMRTALVGTEGARAEGRSELSNHFLAERLCDFGIRLSYTHSAPTKKKRPCQRTSQDGGRSRSPRTLSPARQQVRLRPGHFRRKRGTLQVRERSPPHPASR